MLGVDFDLRVASGDRDISAAGDDVQLHFARDGDIEIGLHGVVAGSLGFRIEG